jgi:hypothetical protein
MPADGVTSVEVDADWLIATRAARAKTTAPDVAFIASLVAG